MTSAAIYARISDDTAGQGLGVQRQLEDCRKLADRLGWEVSGEYVDNDLSAYSGKPRPAYLRLLDDARAGRIRGILAWHPDRLHRSPRELETFIDVVEPAGIDVQTVTAGTVDLATPSGRAVARTLGAWARYESEHKGERIRRKHAELAEAGMPVGGGTRPFGFEADRVTIRVTEAVAIREAAARLLHGASIRRILIDWGSEGIVTPTGGRWAPQPFRRMMLSARIAGWRSHRGELVAPATWPAIIDRSTHDRLVAILSDPQRRTATSNRVRYLLTGFLRCGNCGGHLRGRPREDHVRRYVCVPGPMYGTCGKLAVLAEPVEALVTAAVLDAIDSPEMQAAIAARLDTASSVDVDRLRQDQEALEQLSRDYYVERVIGRAEWQVARDALEVRIVEQRSALASVTPLVAGLAVRARWTALDLEDRRAVLATLIERVDVAPGRAGYNRFDPDRVGIRWLA